MTKDEALKLALEALTYIYTETTADEDELIDKAIAAIKEALAKEKALQALHDENERLGLYKDAYAEQEQEPVAVKHMMEWVDYLKRKSDYGQHMQIPSEMSAGACWELAIELEQFINTTPPQRKPLTDEDVERIVREARVGEHGIGYTIARAIEAAHGIKE